jgi:hypothetical protein
MTEEQFKYVRSTGFQVVFLLAIIAGLLLGIIISR